MDVTEDEIDRAIMFLTADLAETTAERDRYKAALEEINKEPRNLRCEWMRQTAREALGDPTMTEGDNNA